MRQLNKQIALPKLDPTVLQQPVYGGNLRLSFKDSLLIGNNSWQALEIYLDLLSDARLQAVLTRQFNEIVMRELIIEPGGKADIDDYAAKHFEATLDALQAELTYDVSAPVASLMAGDQSMDTLVKSLLTAVVTHFSAAEMVYKRDKQGYVTVDRAIALDPRRFIFEDKDGKIFPRLVTRTDAYRGLELPANKFVFYRHWALFSSDQLGSGYGPALYWLIQWKREAMTFWLSVLDRHADPALVGTVPKNATTADIDAFLVSLESFSRETNIVMKEGFSIDTLSTDPGKAAELLQNLITYVDTEIDYLLTGEKSIEDASRENASIRNSIRLASAKAWSDALHLTIRSTLALWLTRWNFPDARVPKLTRRWVSLDDILSISSTYKQLGFTVDPDFLQDATGVPIKPKEARKASIPKAPAKYLQ